MTEIKPKWFTLEKGNPANPQIAPQNALEHAGTTIRVKAGEKD